MAPGKYNDSRLIARIARECDLSVSGVYGILNGDPGFSSTHRTMVEELARRYGLTLTGPESDPADITLGILIPKLPGYFWNEAIAGMKRAVAIYREAGLRIKLLFRYFSPDLTEDTDDRLIEGFAETPCDGYILYPLLRERLWRFCTELAPEIPLLVFNDWPCQPEQRHFFDTRPASTYVCADNRFEGEQAAAIMEPHIIGAKHLVALTVGPKDYLGAGLARMEGFTTRMRTIAPYPEIEVLPMEVAKKTSASLLAAQLEPRLLDRCLDGVYVTAGFTHIAAAAIRKICRKHGADELSIPCIGHESAPSDKPYLLDGILRGYVRQDIHTQGLIAIREVVEQRLHHALMRPAVVRSSVYVKDIHIYGSSTYMTSAARGLHPAPTTESSPAGRSKIAILPNGVYEVSSLLQATVKSPPVQPPKPPRAAQYIRARTDADRADGTLRILAPDGIRPTAYALRWASANGPLAGVPALPSIPYLGEDVTVYSLPEGTHIPPGADRILVWSINDAPAPDHPAAAIIIGSSRPSPSSTQKGSAP